MPNQEAIDYIKQARGQSIKDEVTKRNLMAVGYEPSDIDEAFVIVGAQTEMPTTADQGEAPPAEESEKKIGLVPVIAVVAVLVVVGLGYVILATL